jgi:predicted  nucleic acid-binding Zn-ribbon protein
MSRTLVKPEEQLARQLEVGPGPEGREPTQVDLVLLARLELCAEMLDTAQSGRDEIERRITNIRGLLDPSTLQHYDQLKKRGGSALAAVEGDTCQGCFRQLPSQLVQGLRSESSRVYTCTHCSRFVYGL